MSTTIKNVTVAGASGSIGAAILHALNASGHFSLTVLKRHGSEFNPPEGVRVVSVDYSSQESLTTALIGQDAIISALGHAALLDQITLADAAVKAGVTRFIPSEYGCNLSNELARKLPSFADKIKTQEHLFQLSQSTRLSYTIIYCTALLDWGLEYDFILRISDYKPKLYNGGEQPFSATYLSTVGQAVASILAQPEQTKNTIVRVHDMVISQKRLLQLAQEVAPHKSWEPQNVSLDEITAAADERREKGLFDMETMMPYLFRGIMDPKYGGQLADVDNELLGIVPKTEEDVRQTLRKLIG